MGVPNRTCVACRQPRPKASLVRLAVANGKVMVDPLARLPGRGAYVCPDRGCRDAALKRDAAAVRRALHVPPRVATVEADTLRAAVADTTAAMQFDSNEQEHDPLGARPAAEQSALRGVCS